MTARRHQLSETLTPLTLSFARTSLLLLFWFRADTIAGYQLGDIAFTQDGAMVFTIRRLKRRAAERQPFVKSIPPPTNPTQHLLFRAVQHAISLKTAADPTKNRFSEELWGSRPTAVSDRISRAMDRILPRSRMHIPAESFISSHSWRKTSASAAASCGVDWHVI
eukprot:SAG31_NODE_14084_length_828_cov_0.978052_1_plen_164_part_01